MKAISLGRVAGLDLSLVPSALAGSVVMWVFFSAVGGLLLGAGRLDLVIGGFALVLLHWLSELFHNIGHATAAARAGHPMTGVQFYLIVARSQYPPDEAGVTPAMHIRRALGGPAASAALSVLSGLGALALFALHGRFTWVAFVWFLDNLFFFTLGAFLPLGFNDGSTLLHWTRHRVTESSEP